jgi:tight adherence protein C
MIAAYAAVGASVYLFCRVLFSEEATRSAQENLESNDGAKKSENALINLTRPLFNQYFVPLIQGQARWDDLRITTKRKLITSGLRDQLTPDEFIAFKMILIMVFPVIGILLKSIDVIDAGPMLLILSGVGGWFYPDLWVKSRIAERHREVLMAFPFVVDLLALATEAGLDFMGAIQRVVEKAKPSPLIEELDQLLKEIKVGSSRSEALREMGIRIGLQEVNSFCAILISADQMGASIGKILRQQSDQVRNDRMIRAERAGMAAVQKLVIPMLLIAVPAVLIMILAPYLLNMAATGN